MSKVIFRMSLVVGLVFIASCSANRVNDPNPTAWRKSSNVVKKGVATVPTKLGFGVEGAYVSEQGCARTNAYGNCVVYN